MLQLVLGRTLGRTWWVLALGLGCSSTESDLEDELPPSGGRGGAPSASGGAAERGGATSSGGASPRGGAAGSNTQGGANEGGAEAGGTSDAGAAPGGSTQGGASAGGASAGGPAGDAGAGGAGEPCSPIPCSAECAIAERVEVPLDLLGSTSAPPSVVRLGEGFALFGIGRMAADGRAAVALLDWDGVVEESSFSWDDPCPGDVCAPAVGITPLLAASDKPQLVLTDRGSGAAMTLYPFRAVAFDENRAEPFVTPLFESNVVGQTAVYATKTSRNGRRAVFAMGNPSAGNAVKLAELGPDAELIGSSTLTLPSGAWDCLDVISTEAGAAVSVVVDDGNDATQTWTLRELDASADVVFETSVPVPVSEALGYTSCPVVVAGSGGYHAQFGNLDGKSLLATVERGDTSGMPTAVLGFPESPGSLVGAFGSDWVVLATLEDARLGFRRLTPSRELGEVLYLLPEDAVVKPSSLPKLLSVEGSSLYFTYDTASVRVIERVACP